MGDANDEEAFREFVVSRWNALARTAYLLTGDHGRAEDLVQDALERAHRHWGRMERQDAPEVYVRRVMVNQAISWSRRRRFLELPLLASHAPPVDPYGDHDLRDALWTAMATLPPRMRAVLVLRFYEDLTEAEIAAALGCSIGSVKSQSSRGLARLRQVFGNDEGVVAEQLAAIRRGGEA